MPMREYLCQPCRRVYTFLTATVDDPRRPVCPRCGSVELERQVSTFARTQRRKEPLAAIPKRPGDPEVAGLSRGRRAADGGTVESDPEVYLIWEHCRAEDPSPVDDPNLRPVHKEVHQALGGEGPRPPGLVVKVRQRDDGR